ncbi:MAG: ribosome biogenesis GTPase Der, partial [Planctomycetota bacterium]
AGRRRARAVRAMSLPVVAIVGRPNVGKSTLFNALARRRISIVEPTSGVTRDRVSTTIREGERALELVDTGGMGIDKAVPLAADIEEQIRFAVDRADVLVLVVDARAGLIPQDAEIAAELRRLGKPLILVANKVESARTADTAAEFHALGLGEPALVSARHGRGTTGLRERLFALAGRGRAAPPAPELQLAIVGRRNVGKSTLINTLADEKRVVVSELAGTTRDAVDVRFERDGRSFVAIDTAGLRKNRQVSGSIDFYGQVRTHESVRRADVALLMLDAAQGIGRLDKKLAASICEEHKPCVIVVNKWDLAEGVGTDEYLAYISQSLPGLAFAPVCFISALRGERVSETIDVARSLWRQAQTRVPTAELNKVIEGLKGLRAPTAKASRRPKIYYGTQVDTAPPTIVLFVNSPRNFSGGHRRAIENFFREHLPFHEIPIRVRYKAAKGRDRE